MAHKYCYLFSEGNATMRELLGGKGAKPCRNDQHRSSRTPRASQFSTEACTKYYEDGRKINDDIMAEINEYIVKMEGITGKKFGDKEKSPARICTFRCKSFYARHDGYYP